MSVFRNLDRQLRSEGSSQALALFLVSLLLGLAFSWSGNPLVPNESWFTIETLSGAGLTLLAPYHAARSWSVDPPAAAASCLMLVFIWLTSVPFRLAAFAASHPAASLGLSVTLDLVFSVALYGLCLLLGRLLPKARWLALPLGLLTVILLTAADELLPYRLFNPFPGATAADWPVTAVWSAAAVLTGVWLFGRLGRQK